MTQQRQVPEIPQMIEQTQHVSSGNQPYLQTSLQTQPLTFEEEQEQALRYIPSSQSTIQPEMLLETVQTGEMVQTGQMLQTSETENIKVIPSTSGDKPIKVVVIEKVVESSKPKTSPIPKSKQDPTRHYCDACNKNYSRKDLLASHKKYNCLRTEKDFICEKCSKEYGSDETLRMHYYKEHLKKFLYFCTKCNQGFNYKNRITSHHPACPNKDDPDKYPAMQKDATLEHLFRRRKRIDVPEKVLEVLDVEDPQGSGIQQGLVAGSSVIPQVGGSVQSGLITGSQVIPQLGMQQVQFGSMLHQGATGNLQVGGMLPQGTTGNLQVGGMLLQGMPNIPQAGRGVLPQGTTGNLQVEGMLPQGMPSIPHAGRGVLPQGTTGNLQVRGMLPQAVPSNVQVGGVLPQGESSTHNITLDEGEEEDDDGSQDVVMGETVDE